MTDQVRKVVSVRCCGGQEQAMDPEQVRLVLFRYAVEDSYFTFFCRIGKHWEQRKATADITALLRSVGVVPMLVTHADVPGAEGRRLVACGVRRNT